MSFIHMSTSANVKLMDKSERDGVIKRAVRNSTDLNVRHEVPDYLHVAVHLCFSAEWRRVCMGRSRNYDERTGCFKNKLNAPNTNQKNRMKKCQLRNKRRSLFLLYILIVVFQREEVDIRQNHQHQCYISKLLDTSSSQF